VGVQGTLKGHLVAEMFDDVNNAMGQLTAQVQTMSAAGGGTAGPQGPAGATGPQGAQGPQGGGGSGSGDFAMDFLVMGG
jgi:hypothetical protein